MTNKGLLKNIPAEQWDKVKILDSWTTLMVGKMEQGKFISQEAFGSIVSIMGEQEVEYELINQQAAESEIQKLEKQVEEIAIDKENQPKKELRNILLIGRTGNGKSTLGNVLINKNDNFEEVFTESAASISVTKKIQAEIVEIDGVEYRIIDTIGIGDTKLDVRDVLLEISNAAHMVKEGLHQVLFVAAGRFTAQEVDAYELLRAVIFDENIARYTTIVRTRFPAFRKAEKWAEDKKNLIKENKEMAAIIESCNKVIYVDNPSLEDVGNPMLTEMNRSTREESRERLSIFLSTCDKAYKPKNLDELNERISKHKTESEKYEVMINDLLKKTEEDRQLAKEKEEEMRREIEEKQKRLEEEKKLSDAEREKLSKSMMNSQAELTKLLQSTQANEKKMLEEIEINRKKQQELENQVVHQMAQVVEKKGMGRRLGSWVGRQIDRFNPFNYLFG